MDIRRAQDWLDERKNYWTAAVRKSEDLVFQTKNELTRRRMMRIGERNPDCSEQEAAFHAARRQLEAAQEKLASCRRWQRKLVEALVDFEGPANQLSGVLDGEAPRALAYLDGKIASLEAYTRAS